VVERDFSPIDFRLLRGIVRFKVLRFDRFALDLTRGSLRSREQGIDRQPKSFAVL
jgi:hypothetical protein